MPREAILKLSFIGVFIVLQLCVALCFAVRVAVRVAVCVASRGNSQITIIGVSIVLQLCVAVCVAVRLAVCVAVRLAVCVASREYFQMLCLAMQTPHGKTIASPGKHHHQPFAQKRPGHFSFLIKT